MQSFGVQSVLKVFCVLALSSAAHSDAAEYGQPLTLKNPVEIEKALENQPSGEFLMSGQVDKVCKKKGCWMGFKSSKGDVRVTFKDYKYFVPASLVGKHVLVQGVLTKKTLTLAETRHYIEDEGGDASKVTEPRTEYSFVATGVRETRL